MIDRKVSAAKALTAKVLAAMIIVSIILGGLFIYFAFSEPECYYISYRDLEDGVMPSFEMPEDRATVIIDTTGKVEKLNSVLFENIQGGAGAPTLQYLYDPGLTVDTWEISFLIDQTTEENVHVQLFQNVEYEYNGEWYSSWGFTIGVSCFDGGLVKVTGEGYPAMSMRWSYDTVYTMTVKNIDYENETADLKLSGGGDSETMEDVLFVTRTRIVNGIPMETSKKIDGFGISASTWHPFKVYFDYWTDAIKRECP